MATFKDRIEDLAGTIPSTADGEQFLKDGVVDVVHRVIAAHPQHISLFSKNESISDSGTTVHDVHIQEVTRDNTACREIAPTGRHGASDSASIHYASTDDPVYYFLNEKIYVLPTGGSPSMSILEHGTVTDWDSGTSAISYMPSHHYNQVIIYAAMQVLHHKMVEMETNDHITTAFIAAHTELDETQAICDSINADLVLAKAEIVLAKTEAAELATQTDNSSTFNTALAAIATELNKVDDIIVEASTEFDKVDNVIVEGSVELDKSSALLDSGEADSESAVNTALGKIVTELDETQAICDLINSTIDSALSENGEAATAVDASVDTALAAIVTAAGRINTAVALANAEFDKCDTMLDLGEADTEGDVNTALTAMNTELDETQAICDTLNSRVDDAVTEIVKAVTEAGEMIAQTDNSGDFAIALTAINSAVDKFRADAADPSLFGDESTYTTGTGMTSVKTYIDRAISYINGNFPHGDYDLVANLADIDADLTSEDIELASGRMQQAQTTLSAVQADIGIAQTYITEWTTMVQTLVAEIDGFSKEVQSRATFTGAKGQAVQAILSEASAYLNAAQGYGSEIQTKINISNGYASEINSRLSQAAAKREESAARIGVGSA